MGGNVHGPHGYGIVNNAGRELLSFCPLIKLQCVYKIDFRKRVYEEKASSNL